MSTIESHIDLTPEQKAAWDLVNESELLKADGYARRVVEADGLAESGKKVDLGDFLEARQAVLERDRSEGKVAAAKRKNPEAYEVANSVRPDAERNLYN